MNSVRRWRAVAVVAMAALVLSACGGGGSEEEAADGDPVEGGSLSLIQMAEPRILDPAVMTNSYATNAIAGNALFGTLLTDDPEGSLHPSLAQSLKSEDGGTTWELKLRDGLTFSDGSPLDAEAVAYNWERIKDPELGSTSKASADYLGDLTPEGQVLTFTLTEPIANFGNAITFNSSLNWIAKPDALEAGQAAFDKNPIGAGPFMMKSWTRGGEMVLAKNPEYFDAPKPYLDELVLTANGDEGQRLSTVESGGADATVHSSMAYYNRGVENGLKGILPALNGGITMNMNARFAPFDDPRAREAVAKGVDLEAINQAAYEGEATVPESYFTEESPFYNDVPLTSYDKAAAQKLFDELADEGKPVKFTITAYQTSESRRVAEAFQAQLGGYDNVKVGLEVLDFPAATAKVNNREFQMAPGGIGSFDPEPETYRLLHSGSAGNVSGVDDAELDDALERGRVSTDADERKVAYEAFSERLAATNPVIFYVRYTSGVTHGDAVAGIEQYGNASTRLDGAWTTKQ